MPVSIDFKYRKPKDMKEAVTILAEDPENSKILAGGTDLLVYLKEDIISPSMIIDIKGIPDIEKIDFKNNILTIGAGVSFTAVEESKEIREHFRVLYESAATVASIGIRNRATVVGNICSAVPSLDAAPALLLYDTKVHVMSVLGERIIDIQDWFVSPKKTALKSNEIVTHLSITLPEKKSASCYKKLGRYKGEDLAQAGLGVLVVEGNEYRIAVCAVGPVPTRAKKTEAFLRGKEIDESLTKEAQEIIATEISPITDIRASKEYRTHIIQVMLERALKESNELLIGTKIKSEPIL